jgi:hypothetical protein
MSLRLGLTLTAGWLALTCFAPAAHAQSARGDAFRAPASGMNRNAYGGRRAYNNQQYDFNGYDRIEDANPGVARNNEEDAYRAEARRNPRGGLGISLRETDQGVLVTRVYPHSPAQRAGFQQGDQVVGVEGEPVDSLDQLVRDGEQRRPGSRVSMQVLRDGQRLTLQARLEPREQALAGRRQAFQTQQADRQGQSPQQRQIDRLERTVERLARQVDQLSRQLAEQTQSRSQSSYRGREQAANRGRSWDNFWRAEPRFEYESEDADNP